MKYDTLTIVGTERDNEFVGNVVKVNVQQSRTIRSGDDFYMVPSQAYAGVDLGYVQIEAIGTPDELYLDDKLGTTLANDIGEFIEIDLDAYDDPTERKEVLEHGLWVVYRYNSNDYLYVFPIEEFLEHSVRAI